VIHKVDNVKGHLDSMQLRLIETSCDTCISIVVYTTVLEQEKLVVECSMTNIALNEIEYLALKRCSGRRGWVGLTKVP
jgi:hypothetical protein